MMPLPFYVGISGHRELENPEQVRADILAFLHDEKKKHPNIIGISALAEGADSIFAEVILDLGFPLEVLLPFQQAEYEKDFAQNPDALKVFRDIISKAQRVGENSQLNGSSSDERNEAYLACGKGMVDKPAKMIFVYNGEKSNGKGGTGDIYEYCKINKRDFVEIRAYQNKIQRVKCERDAEAILAQTEHKRLWTITVRSGLLAVLIFAFTLSFEIPKPVHVFLKTTELISIFIGVFLFFTIEKGQIKGDRIKSRRDAELLRIVEIFMKGGIKLWPLHTVRLSEIYISEDVKVLLSEAEQNRHQIKKIDKQIIAIKEIVNDQLEYHNTRIEKIKRRLPKYEMSQTALLMVFVVVSLFHFDFSVYERFTTLVLSHNFELMHSISTFIILSILPLVASIEASIYFSEFKKNKKDSEFMTQYLEDWNERLQNISKTDDLEKLANEIRQKMDDENINWAISTDANANGKF